MYKKTTPQKGSHWSSTSMNEDICWLHSSEISGLGLMKCSLRNTSKFAPYLWNKKNPKYSFFHFKIFEIITHKPIFPVFMNEKKLLWSFLLPKILGKLWSVWFKHFIKRKPFISEECTYVRNKNELVWLLLIVGFAKIFSLMDIKFMHWCDKLLLFSPGVWLKLIWFGHWVENWKEILLYTTHA